mgnify:CR=1 FL=1
MNGNYLIPANTKRGQLIFGLFREVDLIIFGVGVVLSFILMMILPLENTVMAVLAVAPGLTCAFLVAPVPYYHNVMTLLIELYHFFTDRQRFIWKGWCFTHGETEKK